MEGEVDDEDGTFTNISLADDLGKSAAASMAGSPEVEHV